MGNKACTEPSEQTLSMCLKLPSIPLAKGKAFDQGILPDNHYVKEPADEFKKNVKDCKFDPGAQYTYIVDNKGYVRYYKFGKDNWGHTAMLHKDERTEKPVKYAGNFYTYGKGAKTKSKKKLEGCIKKWKNNSGHFEPDPELALGISNYLDLPPNRFEAWKIGDKAHQQIINTLKDNQYWDYDHDVLAWYDQDDFNQQEYDAAQRMLMRGGSHGADAGYSGYAAHGDYGYDHNYGAHLSHDHEKRKKYVDYMDVANYESGLNGVAGYDAYNAYNGYDGRGGYGYYYSQANVDMVTMAIGVFITLLIILCACIGGICCIFGIVSTHFYRVIIKSDNKDQRLNESDMI